METGLLQQIVDSAADAVIVVDAGGQVVYWNGGAERIFGYSPAEAVGASLDLIIPERLRERHWSGFHHAIETGTTRYGASDLLAVPAQTKDGRRVSVEFSVVLLPAGEGGTLVGAIMRDVTERFAQEKELRRRLAELEGQVSGGGAVIGGSEDPG